MVNPSKFVCDLAAYKITPQDVWAESAPHDLLKLDWNESPNDFDFYLDELRSISSRRGIVAWYPDYMAIKLTHEIARYVGINENLVLTFPGSDVGLETLCRAYLDQGDFVIALYPTYENFFVYVLQTGAVLEKFNINPPFEFDRVEFSEYIKKFPNLKMVYIVRPNNPCGYMINEDDVHSLASEFNDVLFVIDEAYIEFSDHSSCADLVQKLNNLVVARTFSKAFGMAGLRLGYLCAPSKIINTLNKIRNGKNISMIAQALGVSALRNFDRIQNWIDDVKLSRNMFENWCRDRSVEYWHSHGNFVMMRVKQPAALCSLLKADGIYVRNRNEIIPGAIRITMGGAVSHKRLIDALTMHEHCL